MAKLLYANGTTSVILRVRIGDTTSTSNAGLTGLTFESSGLIISTIADNEATATAYTVAGSTIETISTLGTFAAPTATKCRFKEVDSTNHPGLYEIQIADARWAVASARSVVVTVLGATNAAQVDAEVQLHTVAATVAGAVGSVTGNVGGNVTGSVGSVTAAVTANVTQLNGQSTVDGLTPEESLSIILAALAGKVSGAGSNAPVFRSADDAANRITATTDSSGNRTAVTLNPA